MHMSQQMTTLCSLQSCSLVHAQTNFSMRQGKASSFTDELLALLAQRAYKEDCNHTVQRHQQETNAKIHHSGREWIMRVCSTFACALLVHKWHFQISWCSGSGQAACWSTLSLNGGLFLMPLDSLDAILKLFHCASSGWPQAKLHKSDCTLISLIISPSHELEHEVNCWSIFKMRLTKKINFHKWPEICHPFLEASYVSQCQAGQSATRLLFSIMGVSREAQY